MLLYAVPDLLYVGAVSTCTSPSRLLPVDHRTVKGQKDRINQKLRAERPAPLPGGEDQAQLRAEGQGKADRYCK